MPRTWLLESSTFYQLYDHVTHTFHLCLINLESCFVDLFGSCLPFPESLNSLCLSGIFSLQAVANCVSSQSLCIKAQDCHTCLGVWQAGSTTLGFTAAVVWGLTQRCHLSPLCWGPTVPQFRSWPLGSRLSAIWSQSFPSFSVQIVWTLQMSENSDSHIWLISCMGVTLVKRTHGNSQTAVLFVSSCVVIMFSFIIFLFFSPMVCMWHHRDRRHRGRICESSGLRGIDTE